MWTSTALIDPAFEARAAAAAPGWDDDPALRALRRLAAVRPVDWDDAEHPDLAAAWRMADAVLADPDQESPARGFGLGVGYAFGLVCGVLIGFLCAWLMGLAR